MSGMTRRPEHMDRFLGNDSRKCLIHKGFLPILDSGLHLFLRPISVARRGSAWRSVALVGGSPVRIAEYPFGLRRVNLAGAESRITMPGDTRPGVEPASGNPRRDRSTIGTPVQPAIGTPVQPAIGTPVQPAIGTPVQPAIGTVRPVASRIRPKRHTRGWWCQCTGIPLAAPRNARGAFGRIVHWSAREPNRSVPCASSGSLASRWTIRRVSRRESALIVASVQGGMSVAGFGAGRPQAPVARLRRYSRSDSRTGGASNGLIDGFAEKLFDNGSAIDAITRTPTYIEGCPV